MGGGATCGFAAELYRVEVNEIEDIGHLNLVEIYDKTVGRVLRGDAVDDDVLRATMHGKVIHQQIILVVEDIRGFYIPCAVVQDNVGGLYAELGFGLT